jgi:hypothetical protein
MTISSGPISSAPIAALPGTASVTPEPDPTPRPIQHRTSKPPQQPPAAAVVW